MAHSPSQASVPNDRQAPAITWRGAYSLDQREAMIREAAYYLAQARGFTPGHDLEDWLSAEAAIEGGLVDAGDAAAFPVQQSGMHGAGTDEELKRIVKQHPQRAIPQIESVEPQEAPWRE